MKDIENAKNDTITSKHILEFFIIVCYFLDFSKKQGKGVQKSGYDTLFQNCCIYMVAETKKRQWQKHTNFFYDFKITQSIKSKIS